MISDRPDVKLHNKQTVKGKRWIGAAALTVALVALPLLITPVSGDGPDARPGQPPRDPFVATVEANRFAVLAVGTYGFKDTPTAQYYGTGFVVGDGNIAATNEHVIAAIKKKKKLDQLTLFLPGQRPDRGRPAKLIGQDRFHDVAILRFAGPPIKPLTLDTTGKPAQGQTVGIIGYPIGMHLGVVPAAHKGVIAAIVPAVRPLPKGAKLTPELAKAIQQPYQFYQLDLVVYPGNSGSPLFDVQTGKVLGVINKTLAAKTREHLLTNPSGIAYAVQVRWVDELTTRYRKSVTAKETRP